MELLSRRSFIGAGLSSTITGFAIGAGDALAQNIRHKENIPKIKNVLVLLVDQQRWDCIACNGNKVVQTPNIDRLAQNGVNFTNAYSSVPVCTPARTCLETGLWAHKHNNLYNGTYDPTAPFFSEALRDKGWQLAHIGKWHIGSKVTMPEKRGYDGSVTYYKGYGFPSRHQHYLTYLKELGVNGFNAPDDQWNPDATVLKGSMRLSGLQEGPQEASVPAYLAHQTMDVINRYTASDNPFFVSTNFWGPHRPYYITEKHYHMYDNTDIEPWPNWNEDLSDKPDAIRKFSKFHRTEWVTPDKLSRIIGKYYGYITLIDEEIGRILDTLKKTGKYEETLIVFAADHGSTVGSHRAWDKGIGMYDCITHIPFIISHPSIKPRVSDAFVSHIDLAPTFLDLAGQPHGDMDGCSLMPILTGDADSVREDYITTESFGLYAPYWMRMVRTPTTKYVFSPVGDDEFYDLADDPWEMENIHNKMDGKVLKDHIDRMITWMEETHDPMLRVARRMLL